MAICLEIIKLHGGHITLHSPPESDFFGKIGTEFVVQIPDFSEKEAFLEMIKDRIRDVAREKKSLSIVRISLKNMPCTKERLDDFTTTMDNVSRVVSDCVKKGVDDVVFLPGSRKLFLLLVTEPSGVPIVMKRIKKEMLQYCREHLKIKKPSVRVGYDLKSYPQDFTDLEILNDWLEEDPGE